MKDFAVVNYYCFVFNFVYQFKLSTSGFSTKIIHQNDQIMKPARLILITLLFLNFSAFAQENEALRKSSFEFWAGLENRITPIYNPDDGIIDSGLTPVNIDRQLSGTSLSLGVAYRIMPVDITLVFEYAIRYDQIYHETPGSNGVGKVVKGLIHDYHFRLFKTFRINKFVLRPGLGYSLLNRGTDYILDDGSLSGMYTDSAINPFDLSIGTDIGRVSLDLRCYLISETNYLPAPGFMVLPEIKILYRVPL